MDPFFSIRYYHDFISPSLAHYLLSQARPVEGVSDLVEVGKGGGLESADALRFLTALYASLEEDLARVLKQRTKDRRFIDERVRSIAQFNTQMGRDFLDPDYKTVLGLADANGRIVFGPKPQPKNDAFARAGGKPVAPLPEFLKGPHVTLFGPPDSAKMAINAMNAYHRRPAAESAIVSELLARQSAAPIWGADDEDSKTPIRADLIDAAVNLKACHDRDLSLQEDAKTYELAADHLSLPIKRFPGLALPSTFLFYKKNPIPLHLYDFALHLYHCWSDPRALVFYVPKLENEEEARYIHKMIALAEAMIQKDHPEYALGTVRLMIVLENPRALLRTHEIMDALHPYFAGASLGWHDYLASTARLFKEDPNYRIPVKADPDIVIKYVQASHRLLADVVGSRGGIKIGGMYGILPVAGHDRSLQITLKGFIKDVVTQLKRGLTGFWVAHPDFVRLGLAIVQAWSERATDQTKSFEALVRALLESQYHDEVFRFANGPDVPALDPGSPGYVRSLIVADLKESDFVPNHDPSEIRYNVSQSLQYLADWLSGNGCVALPASIGGVPVRVMDDLATTERSRWEVWHELRHGRVSVEAFLQIVHEEMGVIRRDLSNEKNAKWYPIAMRLMLQLMTDPKPVEFATELLMPFVDPSIRDAEDPWAAVQKIDPEKYRLPKYVADFDHYFEICGCRRFAQTMANAAVEDETTAEAIVRSFALDEVLSAASFHGDIGQSKKTLDGRAAQEQSGVGRDGDDARVLEELRSLGERYRTKHGFKFLISAQGKSAAELLTALKERIARTTKEELEAARTALWEITRKRMLASPRGTKARIEAARIRHRVAGLSVAVNYRGETQTLSFGETGRSKDAVTAETLFQIASLSKTVASAFAIEFFRSREIPLDSPVNALLRRARSPFTLRVAEQSDLDPSCADRVTISDLMSHSALNMHYVNGVPDARRLPETLELIRGSPELRYEPVRVIAEPGTKFQYSGGGFLVLEHLVDALAGALSGKRATELAEKFLADLKIPDLCFGMPPSERTARGSSKLLGEPLCFPAFAAGAWGTARAVAKLLAKMTAAFQSIDGAGVLSHDTAVQMLWGSDRGSRAFMGCDMGLGVFVAEAGPNRLAIHQGSNEGFRAIFVQCFSGPDAGHGCVVLCNGDNQGVPLIADVVREVLSALGTTGIDFDRLDLAFDDADLPQEQIVNLGYKKLIFEAFEPDLPEAIIECGEPGDRDPLASANLAVGARIVAVSNQKFARAENLISPYLPVFDPELYGAQGKVMDSWETARHSPESCDRLHLALARPSVIRYVSLSTQFHDGNHPEFVRLSARDQEMGATGANGAWSEILPKSALMGHALLRVDLGATNKVFSEVVVEIFPDGGLSRLGLYRELPELPESSGDKAAKFAPITEAKPERFPEPIPKPLKPLVIPYQLASDEVTRNLKSVSRERVDWASLAFGGSIVSASNEHYGPAVQVLSPFPALSMFDGFESARSRKPGHFEEVAIQLGKRVRVESVLLDFKFFVNNGPMDVELEGLFQGKWRILVPKTRVKAFSGNQRVFRVDDAVIDQMRVRVFPDGGINRITVRGVPV